VTYRNSTGDEQSPVVLFSVRLFGVDILIVYAILGPGLWALFALSLALGYARMNRLRRPAAAMTVEPKVSVLIPAKDEGERIRECLDSVLALDYPNLEIICIDDRSGDETGAVMDEYAAKFPHQLRVIHIADGALPPGWLGKCHALWTAAKEADGDWILFVDSDVKVEPDALSCALALAVGREYDALSIMTKLRCESFLEHAVLPLAAASVSSMCLISLTNDDNRKTAFANGQFFLIKRNAYEAAGGHEIVKDHITEDVALMRILKSRGFRARLYLGRKFAATRMHSTYRQMLSGWGRIFSGVSGRKPWRILAAAAFVLDGLLAWVMAPFAATTGDAGWIAAAVVHWILVTGVVATFYHWSGNRMRWALVFPISALLLLTLYGKALVMCVTGKVAWRGTSYTYGAVSSR
jgi:cellulose synthase/poly-beta-1,6-N-acetylglucosamine synthase-like glycosyltransferase